jgi:hypothetical protein
MPQMAGLPSVPLSKVNFMLTPAPSFALSDSDITIRRKSVFLINTFLTPTIPEMHSSSQPANEESVPDLNPHQAEPVYANSHARMFADPGSAETSPAI